MLVEHLSLVAFVAKHTNTSPFMMKMFLQSYMFFPYNIIMFNRVFRISAAMDTSPFLPIVNLLELFCDPICICMANLEQNLENAKPFQSHFQCANLLFLVLW